MVLLVLSAGGVKLINSSRRITIDNTLDERLRLLEDRVCVSTFLVSVRILHLIMQMLPEIRKDLFGANENRKFYT
jgi:V-type H+-transporting ATPase subunit E